MVGAQLFQEHSDTMVEDGRPKVDKSPYAPRGHTVGTGWPSFYFSADGQSKICNNADEVPEGWAESVDEAKALVAFNAKLEAARSVKAAQDNAQAGEQPASEAIPAEVMPTRAELVSVLKQMGVPFPKTAPTAALLELYNQTVDQRGNQ